LQFSLQVASPETFGYTPLSVKHRTLCPLYVLSAEVTQKKEYDRDSITCRDRDFTLHCNVRKEPLYLSIVIRLRAGRPVFDSRQGLGSFLLATASKPSLGRIQPPIQWGIGSLPGVLSGRGVRLTTHLHLDPRLRIRGCILPFPQSVFKV